MNSEHAYCLHHYSLIHVPIVAGGYTSTAHVTAVTSSIQVAVTMMNVHSQFVIRTVAGSMDKGYESI